MAHLNSFSHASDRTPRQAGEARRTESERDNAGRIRNETLQKLVAADEAQRSEIARELHDRVGQQLTALLLALSDLARRLRGPEEQARIASLQEIAGAMGRDLHALTLRLRPTSLDDLGVVQSVANLVDAWSASTNVKVDFHARGFEGDRVAPEFETTIYRIVEAALTNVRKHARASQVGLVLQRNPEEVSIVVEDDGAGFDVEGLGDRLAGQRLGILAMNERVALLGGQFAIESQPGKGTTVVARLPIPPAKGRIP